MKTLSETVEELKGLQKRAQIITLTPVFLCILAAALMIAGLNPIGGAVAGIALVLQFSLSRREKARYSDAVAAANICFGLCEGLEEPAYTGREGITAQELDGMETLPIGDKSSLLVRQGFSAGKWDLTLKGWEITFNFQDRESGKTRHLFLSGTLLTAQGAGDPAADWLLLRSGLVPASVEGEFTRSKGYRTCPCSEELGEEFHVYTKGDLDQLPAYWEKRLQKVTGEYPAVGAIRLTRDRAAVFLKGRFYTEAVKPGFLPREEQFQHNPLPERDGVWELFRAWGSEGKQA